MSTVFNFSQRLYIFHAAQSQVYQTPFANIPGHAESLDILAEIAKTINWGAFELLADPRFGHQQFGGKGVGFIG